MRKVRASRLRPAVAGRALFASLLCIPLALLLVSGQGLAVASFQPADLASLLDARSPGERTVGLLNKHKRKLVEAPPPQRALGKVFPPKPTPVEQLAKVVVPPEPVQTVPPIVAQVITPPLPIQTASLLAVIPPIVGVSISPFNNVIPPPQLPPVSGAVPEPGTWFMMLLGFGMIGSAIGRRRPQPAVAFAA